ncbi:MAG: ATP-binding protein, partial [Candidatus Krumholzibacteria bacterium]|nr:ATP-binding protein [Candidatus Krumholzibacteria bacterium]
DIHEGIDSALTLIHHELKGRVEVVRDYGELQSLVCYPGKLNQVFLNLLVNASQAIEGKGRIAIKTFESDGEVHVAITDSGKGISQQDLKSIFDPGFTTKGVGVGTGLGLSICYRIVQQHQGRIMVESKVGGGSVFTVVLPRLLHGDALVSRKRE